MVQSGFTRSEPIAGGSVRSGSALEAVGPQPERPPAVELAGIDKRFGLVHANRDIHLAIEAGTIHGIVGENGAGKSTLMNILYGFYQADRGIIRIEGEERRIEGTDDAIAAGIGMVHQHFMLVEPFTVLENLLLGAEGGAVLTAGAARARDEIAALERDYGLEVDLDARVADLPVGIQQRVEILKALFRGARVLILDEPTGVLTPQEADHLFRILRNLKAQGRTVVLITHKLREIMAVTDTVSVMRQGRMVAHRRTSDTSSEELAELMVGRKVLLRVEKRPAAPGAPVLLVEDLRARDAGGVERVKGVSFEVRAGEIVGIAGVAGNGQSELLEALAGIRPFAGRVSIAGHPLDPAGGGRPAGLGHVPEDRVRMGLVRDFEAWENAILGYHVAPAYARAGGFLNRRGIVATCRKWMQGYDIRPPAPELRTVSFSGGNQQKLVLAREMEHDPVLLLVGQPTRGVDIGAIEFIHRRLIAMRDAGRAVLLVSVELDEIMSLADRILVMSGGRLTGELDAADADERRIGLLMAGVTPEKAQAA
ncbi:MAG TPA: ABC transporter ATP-binding protein [Geminicoccaceae bacterium]